VAPSDQLLGIRHQRTQRCAPWQNERIERLFGTFKKTFRKFLATSGMPPELPPVLDIFRFWYNHVRPHQHLDGRTPGEDWAGKKLWSTTEPVFFSEWERLLAGYFRLPS
jgi:putative transposase